MPICASFTKCFKKLPHLASALLSGRTLDRKRSTARIHPSSQFSYPSRTTARLIGMSLFRAAWVKLNCPRPGVGRFHSFMHKRGLAPSPNCECGTSQQTTDHVLIVCPIHRAPHGARDLTILQKKLSAG